MEYKKYVGVSIPETKSKVTKRKTIVIEEINELILNNRIIMNSEGFLELYAVNKYGINKDLIGIFEEDKNGNIRLVNNGMMIDFYIGKKDIYLIKENKEYKKDDGKIDFEKRNKNYQILPKRIELYQNIVKQVKEMNLKDLLFHWEKIEILDSETDVSSSDIRNLYL